ncbi:hypothetical protein AcW1_006237 [Taiwanofungus camphoratus]|nr:hypothetical protein AcW1_006237 [Antrodia cinnamomea]
MLLDFNRCTRPEPLSTANILLPLLTEFPDRVHVSLFRSPKLKGVMAKLVPPRFNEGLGGTWHPKIYGADDDILISGANLNTSYFSDRQDRYIYFTAQSQLSQYCFTFLEQVTAFSYSLLPSPSNKEEYILHWPDDRTHPQSIEEKAQDALTAFHAAYCAQSLGREVPRPTEEYEKPEGGQTDVLLFPIIQAGQFNIREEERCLALLFDELSKKQPASGPAPTKYNGPLLDLTSGYFGLYNAYQELIIRSQMACRVLAASPKVSAIYIAVSSLHDHL